MAKYIRFISILLIIKVLSILFFTGCSKDSTDVNNPEVIKPKANITGTKPASVFSDSVISSDTKNGINIGWDVDCEETGIETVQIQLYKIGNEDSILDYDTICEDGYHLILGLEPGRYEKLVISFKNGFDDILYAEEFINITITENYDVILGIYVDI